MSPAIDEVDSDVDDVDGGELVVSSSGARVVLIPPLEMPGSPSSAEPLVSDPARTNVGLGLKQADHARAKPATATLGRLDTPRRKIAEVAQPRQGNQPP